MGCTTSQLFGFHELCNSIPGLLVDKDDQHLFYSLCKLETAGTISTTLNPSSTQLFYVVISGEVYVTFSGPGIKPITAVTFTAGETIHFFNAKLRASSITSMEFGECLRNGDVKLSLHFRHHVSKFPSRVIGMNRRSFDEFTLKASSRLNAITSFLSMNMVDYFLISPIFQTMTTEQAYMFGPLLKLRLVHAAKEVGAHLPPPPLPSTLIPLEHNTARTPRGTTDHTERGHLIMLLHGGLLSVPVHSNVETIALELLRAAVPADHANGKRGTEPMPSASSVPVVFRAGPDREKSLAWRAPSRIRDRTHSSESGSVLSTVHENSHVSLTRGSIIGSDHYFVCNSDVRIRSYLTTAPSVLGYLPMAALDTLFEVDARFKRVYSRNMFLQIIHWVRPFVPFFADMDDWCLTLLSCKVSLIGKNTGEQVIKRGDPGNCAYIVLTGAVKRTTIAAMDVPRVSPACRFDGDRTNNDECFKVTAPTKVGRILKWGSLFGVTALTTGDSYYSSVFAIEPTLLLCMYKRVLDQIYYNDKAKLCEVRIRLMGAEVDLQHAIDHPTGSALFQQYLTQQLAAENLTFYKAVDRYDSLCRGIVKLNKNIEAMRERLQQESLCVQETRSVATTDNSCSAVATGFPVVPLSVRDAVVCTGTLKGEEHSNSADSTYKRMASSHHTITTAADSASNPSMESSFHSLSLRTKPTISQKPPTRSVGSNRIAADQSTDNSDSERMSSLDYNDNTPINRPDREHFSFRVAEALSAGDSACADNDHISLPPQSRPPRRRIDTATETLQRTDPTASLAQATEDVVFRKHTATAGHPQEPHGLLNGRKPRTRQEFLMAKAARIQAMCSQQTLDSSPYTKQDTGVATVDAPDSDGEEDQQYQTTVAGETYDQQTIVQSALDDALQPISNRIQRKVAKITGKMLSLKQHIVDLFPTAKSIMETYIYEGAVHQLNLPYTVRIHCEKQFQHWCNSLASSSTPAAEGDTLPSTSIPAAESQPPSQMWKQPIDLSFVDLFREAKGEVLKLLRDGMFPRWKTTPEFRSFIAGIKPYKAVEGGAVDKMPFTDSDKDPAAGITRSDSYAVLYG